MWDRESDEDYELYDKAVKEAEKAVDKGQQIGTHTNKSLMNYVSRDADIHEQITHNVPKNTHTIVGPAIFRNLGQLGVVVN